MTRNKNKHNKSICYRTGEIYLCRFNEDSEGGEIRKTRPVVITSQRRYNYNKEIVHGAPITSREPRRSNQIPIDTGVIHGSVLCELNGPISTLRLIKKMENAPTDTLRKVLDTIHEDILESSENIK